MINKWSSISDKLDYAFQPIIHTHTGKIYAVEALIRNFEKIENIHSPHSLFDLAFEDDYLYQFDLILREKAIKKFSQIEIDNIQLYYNLDNRIIYNPNYTRGNTVKILKKYGFTKNVICFELSEKGSVIEQNALSSMIHNYKQSNFQIAIDDFGVGISGLKLLYFSEANIIKLDRFFITNIDTDSKKRLFCNSIIDLAHIMGMKVIAEGVETVNEYYACKNIGADFIQGYFVQKPTLDIRNLKDTYEHIIKTIKNEKRFDSNSLIDEKYIVKYESLNKNETLFNLFTYFKNNKKNSFVPIVDDLNNLIGAIFEVDIKEISYSQYGLSLAKNESYSSKLKQYIKPVISVEISWGIDKTLDIFNNNPNSSGIFITNANKYVGFIDLKSLLSLSHQRNIEIATNLNPLTKLPGNQQIENYILNTLDLNSKSTIHYIYFDFNSFKPFNDIYGFRLGDRAILLFSELLKKHFPIQSFIAHIGGDDFFVSIVNEDIEKVYELSLKVITEFKETSENFYTNEDKSNGYIVAKDRDGKIKKFKFLSCSCAIIEKNQFFQITNFDKTINDLKKASKQSETPILASF